MTKWRPGVARSIPQQIPLSPFKIAALEKIYPTARKRAHNRRVAHGRFRRRPKLWNVRQTVGVANEKKRKPKYRSENLLAGDANREVQGRRRLCTWNRQCGVDLSSDADQPIAWRHARTARERVLGRGGFDCAVARRKSCDPHPGKTAAERGARKAHGCSNAAPLRLLRRETRAPLPLAGRGGKLQQKPVSAGACACAIAGAAFTTGSRHRRRAGPSLAAARR